MRGSIMASRINPALLRYRAVIFPEVQPDGTTIYMAECPDLPGCMSHGVTVEEARQSLEDAKNEYLAALQDRGIEIPDVPASVAVGTITWVVFAQGGLQAVEKATAGGMPTLRVRSFGEDPADLVRV
ncbi:MAG: type II toxin-antitoxin system HicB family antitoxin [Candidatus Rokubacteria bacterium]|nr:type II toxin-antitoxin system HicB family antitoxin [Candidatus Rokubacteria bacterium]